MLKKIYSFFKNLINKFHVFEIIFILSLCSNSNLNIRNIAFNSRFTICIT